MRDVVCTRKECLSYSRSGSSRPLIRILFAPGFKTLSPLFLAQVYVPRTPRWCSSTFSWNIWVMERSATQSPYLKQDNTSPNNLYFLKQLKLSSKSCRLSYHSANGRSLDETMFCLKLHNVWLKKLLNLLLVKFYLEKLVY